MKQPPQARNREAVQSNGLEDSGPADTPAWGELPTEARHPASERLDREPTERIVEFLLDEDRKGLDAARRRSEEIAVVAERVAHTLAAGRDVIFAGAGTSGRLGVLEASECPPTFGTDPERIRGAIAGGRDAVFEAKEGAEDRSQDGAALADTLQPGDLLIGLSASSVTAYVRGAIERARQRAIETVLITCASADKVQGAADRVIALATGPEILTGSTRLKAGSATKAVLNAITTAAMVRLGKVYGNLMVDLRPGSAKLQDRSLRILVAAGVAADRAPDLLERADGQLKTAIVMAHRDLDSEAARALLEQAGGHVRQALSDGLS